MRGRHSSTGPPRGSGPGAQSQLAAWVVLSVFTLSLTAILVLSGDDSFRRFFGNASPLRVALGACAIGGLAMALLHDRAGFRLFAGRRTLHGIRVAALLAAVPGVAIILADLVLRYPRETNVPPPQAFLFYPAIGFIAEMVFHIVPLALLILALSPLRARFGMDRIAWIAMAIVVMAEPTFQVAFMRGSATALTVYTWFHIAAISVLQLYIFRRYDFLSMYAFRLAYYAIWHIGWGALRLSLLFHG